MSLGGLTPTPEVMGAALNVATIADLAALDVSGLTIGTRVWVASVGEPYALAKSTATVDSVKVVAVAGVTGVRWLRVQVVRELVCVINAAVLAKLGTGVTTSTLTLATFAKDIFIIAGRIDWAPFANNLTNPLSFEVLLAGVPNATKRLTLVAETNITEAGVKMAPDITDATVEAAIGMPMAASDLTCAVAVTGGTPPDLKTYTGGSVTVTLYYIE